MSQDAWLRQMIACLEKYTLRSDVTKWSKINSEQKLKRDLKIMWENKLLYPLNVTFPLRIKFNQENVSLKFIDKFQILKYKSLIHTGGNCSMLCFQVICWETGFFSGLNMIKWNHINRRLTKLLTEKFQR